VDRDVGPLDDAAVLRPLGTAPLVFTVDFITPIVDDPYTFGAIAAANSLSDVYAMGGEPQAALAVCGFPSDRLGLEVLGEIFRGGRDKAAEAGCPIVGGHTVTDAELKYGLCVIGTVDSGRPLGHPHARAGDLIVLTKPIGTGIASQAIKKGLLDSTPLRTVCDLMTTLNRAGKEAAVVAGAHALTDITGFGLLGHLHHLCLGAGLAAHLWADRVPVLDFVRPLAESGLCPGGSKNNLAYVTPACHWDDGLAEVDRRILADAQTSGGLLIAVGPDGLDALLRELEARQAPARAVIGELVAGPAGQMHVRARR
jgi:selenide,water dikinase